MSVLMASRNRSTEIQQIPFPRTISVEAAWIVFKPSFPVLDVLLLRCINGNMETSSTQITKTLPMVVKCTKKKIKR